MRVAHSYQPLLGGSRGADPAGVGDEAVDHHHLGAVGFGLHAEQGGDVPRQEDVGAQAAAGGIGGEGAARVAGGGEAHIRGAEGLGHGHGEGQSRAP